MTLEFKYKEAWEEVIVPAYLKQHDSIKKLIAALCPKVADLNQDKKTLDIPLSDEIMGMIESFRGSEKMLARASYLCYFIGHWAPEDGRKMLKFSEVPNELFSKGCSWKVSNVIDQVLTIIMKRNHNFVRPILDGEPINQYYRTIDRGIVVFHLNTSIQNVRCDCGILDSSTDPVSIPELPNGDHRFVAYWNNAANHLREYAKSHNDLGDIDVNKYYFDPNAHKVATPNRHAKGSTKKIDSLRVTIDGIRQYAYLQENGLLSDEKKEQFRKEGITRITYFGYPTKLPTEVDETIKKESIAFNHTKPHYRRMRSIGSDVRGLGFEVIEVWFGNERRVIVTDGTFNYPKCIIHLGSYIPNYIWDKIEKFNNHMEHYNFHGTFPVVNNKEDKTRSEY